MSPVNTTSANQPMISHPNWRSTSETLVALAVGVGERVVAGEAAAGVAAGRHVGADDPKR